MSNKITRRNLLQGAAATSAALAAPVVVTSTALGNAETPAASDRVTVGHLGAGNEGGNIYRGIPASKGLGQSVAVCDCYKSRIERYVKMTGCKGYSDPYELLDHKDLDCVLIATPDHWHVPLAIHAAKKKISAYVEKPLGVTIKEDLMCRKAFQDNKQIFQYGTQQRSSATNMTACQLVRQGKIGKVKRIEVVAPNGRGGGGTTPTDIPEDLNYDLWCGPSQMAPYCAGRCRPPATYMNYDYSIGYLGGWGAHPLDMMVLGSDADLSGNIELEGTGVIDEKALLNAVHSWDIKGKLGEVEFTFKPGRDSTKFVGEGGTITTGRTWMKCEPDSLKDIELDEPIYGGEPHQGSWAGHVIDFLKCVQSRKKTVSPVEDAVRSDIISLLCDIAIRLKRKVVWDPKKEVIVGDAEAQKLTELRPRREKWDWTKKA